MNEKVNDALRAIREWYWSEIRSIAEEGWEKVQSGSLAGAEALQEWLHEQIDGHEFVIYTQQSQMVLLASDNHDACAEDFGAEGIVKDDAVNWALLAYSAMERDVVRQLEALGVDVNDPCPEEGPGGEELGGKGDDEG